MPRPDRQAERLSCPGRDRWSEAHEAASRSSRHTPPEGVAQKVEAGVLRVSRTIRVFTEHDLRLREVQLKTKGLESLGDLNPQTSGLHLSVTVHEDIIRVALKRDARVLPRHPHIERVVHECVHQQRGDWRPLRGTSLPSNKSSIGHLHRRFQPPLDVQQNPPLLGVMSYRFEQQIMRHAVEERSDVKIQHPTLRPAASASHSQCVMGITPRTIAVAVGVEDRLKLLSQQHRRCGLGYPVSHRRHPEHPDPLPMILRYLNRPHRRGHVTTRAHPVPQLIEEIPLAALEHGGAYGVHARRSALGPNLLPRLEHEALANLKRLHRRLCSPHQLLPDQRVGVWVSWPARPLRSSPITGPSPLLRAGPPLRLAVLCPRRFLPPRVLPLAAKGPPAPRLGRRYRDTGSPLPCQRPRRAHATLTPSTARATRRPPSGYTVPKARCSPGDMHQPRLRCCQLFFDASAVVQPRSSSRRIPDPLTASRFRGRFPHRLLTGMTPRRFGLPACTANPEGQTSITSTAQFTKRPSTSLHFPMRTHCMNRFTRIGETADPCGVPLPRSTRMPSGY